MRCSNNVVGKTRLVWQLRLRWLGFDGIRKLLQRWGDLQRWRCWLELYDTWPCMTSRVAQDAFRFLCLLELEKKDARLTELMDAKGPCAPHTEALFLSGKPPLTWEVGRMPLSEDVEKTTVLRSPFQWESCTNCNTAAINSGRKTTANGPFFGSDVIVGNWG